MELNKTISFAQIKAGYYKKAFVQGISIKGKYNFYTKTIELRAM